MNLKQKSWLDWAREIQAIAQSGLHYSENEYDRQRYFRLLELSAEIIGTESGAQIGFLKDVFSKQVGYATPKVDVRAAVFRENQLLMVRERMDGGWTMPGGWADVGDVPSEAAERETWEESGFQVKAVKLVGVYDANRTGPLELFHAYKIIYLCDLIDGKAQTSYETTEVAFFGLNEIPTHLSGERTLPRHIQDAFNAHGNPGVKAIFD